MEKGYLVLLFVAIALVVAMAVTAFWGRGSKHGYGAAPMESPVLYSCASGIERPSLTLKL